MTLYTDKLDYAPGETARITGLVTEGGRLLLQVSHIDLPGSDGIYGTADDILDAVLNSASTDHEAVVVVDGGVGDADGEVNGQIVYEWYVNPDDSLDEAFLVTAQEIGPGADGQYDTADDAVEGPVSYATFTDSLPLTPPIESYYIPLDEAQLLESFDAINTEAADPVTTTIGISVAAAGTIIYYDHREDGYEADITNPVQSSTQIWGDGDVSNGALPGITEDADDILVAGQSIILTSDVDTTDTPTEPYDYNGGDLIQASFPIAVTRAAYPAVAGSLMAGAVEVADTDDWSDNADIGIDFVVPVGPVGSDTDQAFEYNAVYVMAALDDTDVTFKDVSTNTEQTKTLSRGESFYFLAEVGDTISADKPIQANLITGDIGTNYEMRWYSLSPTENWGNDYYAPYAQDGETGFWLYNANPGTITVNYDLEGNTSAGSVTIASGEHAFVQNGDGSGEINLPGGDDDDVGGIRFYSDDDFLALAVVDSPSGQGVDWGYPLMPVEQLSAKAQIGLGYGNTANDSSKGSPSVVWVTPTENATIYVDYDADGVFDDHFVVNKLESQLIFDSDDNDMSGAYIYADNDTDDDIDPEGAAVDFAAVWGQDPDRNPSNVSDDDIQDFELDLGTVIFSMPEITAKKNATHADVENADADGDNLFDPGDIIEFSITILNTGAVTINAGGYKITDDLSSFSQYADYVPGTTTYTYTDDSDQQRTVTVDDGGDDGFPLNNANLASLINLVDGPNNYDDLSGTGSGISGGESHIFTFHAQIKDYKDLPVGAKDIVNTGTMTYAGETEDLIAGVPIDYEASIEIEKATNGEDADTGPGPSIVEGETVTWTYTIKNTGKVDLANVNLEDDKLGDVDANANVVLVESGVLGEPGSDSDGILSVGETWVYTLTGVAEAGQYQNLGTVTADAVYADGETLIDDVDPVTDEDPSHYNGIAAEYGIAIVKEAVGKDEAGDKKLNEVGDVIDYRIVVSNTGNAALTNVVVSDLLLSNNPLQLQSGDTDGDSELDVDETWIYTGTYAITQDDLDGAGKAGDDLDIDNVAKADSDETDPVEDPEETPLDPEYGLAIDKKVVGTDADGDGKLNEVGDVIDYQIVVTNTGTAALTNVVVTDPLLSNNPLQLQSGDTDGDSKLDVDETWIYTGTYAITQDDLDGAGKAGDDLDIDNVAKADSDETDPVEDPEETPLDPEYGLAIDKKVVGTDADGDGKLNEVGDVIDYEIVVTNTGTAALTNVVVTDPLLSNNPLQLQSGDTDGDSELDVDETWIYTGTYAITQDDLDGAGKAGEDLDIDNTATADSDETDPEDDTEETPLERPGSYVMDKIVVDVDGDTENIIVDKAGDVITYQVIVENTGIIDLTGVTLTDPLLTGPNGYLNPVVNESINANGILDVGEVWTYEGTYTVQQEDIDSLGDTADGEGEDGDIANTAIITVDGLPPQADCEKVPIDYDPHATFDKRVVDVGNKGPNGQADVGDIITYELVAFNDGNVTYDDAIIHDWWLEGDPNATFGDVVETGGTGTNGDGILDVGETWTIIATYEVQQSDVDSNGGGDGTIDNTAFLWIPTGDVLDDESVPVQYLPKIEIDKRVTEVTGSGHSDVVVNPGDVVHYEIVVRNTGNVSATEVMIKDEMLTGPHGTMSTPSETGGTGINGDGILDPGETWTVTGTYTVQPEDIQTLGGGDGDIDNTAIAWTNILPDVVDQASVPIATGATIYGTKKGETINGFQTANGQPLATEFNDIIYGRKGKDKIDGEAGNDWIVGQQGKDKLTGGIGYDSFVFDQKAGKKHVDKITDFDSDFDKIVLDKSKFSKLDLGDLDSKYFHVGKKAKDKSDLILYDKNKGTLAYDKDGSKGKHDAEVFAKIGKVDIDADDFFVI